MRRGILSLSVFGGSMELSEELGLKYQVVFLFLVCGSPCG